MLKLNFMWWCCCWCCNSRSVYNVTHESHAKVRSQCTKFLNLSYFLSFFFLYLFYSILRLMSSLVNVCLLTGDYVSALRITILIDMNVGILISATNYFRSFDVNSQRFESCITSSHVINIAKQRDKENKNSWLRYGTKFQAQSKWLNNITILNFKAHIK